MLFIFGGSCIVLWEMDLVLTPELLREVYEMDVYAWMRGLLEPWEMKP